MTHTSSTNSGMMFGPGALAAGLAALMSVELSEQQRLDQEAKKNAQEAQKIAAQTTSDAAVEIGKNEQAASRADGWGSIGSGIAMGSAEALGIGINLKMSGDTKTLTNNKNCRDILANPAKVSNANVAFNNAPSTAAEAKIRMDNWDADKDISEYGNAELGYGEGVFASDAKVLELNDPEALQNARDRVEKKVKESTKNKQSADAGAERWASVVKTMGQVSGQLATGSQAMVRGEQQAEKGQEECLKAESDFLNASARGNADAQQKNVDLAQSNDQAVQQMYSSLIQANRA